MTSRLQSARHGTTHRLPGLEFRGYGWGFRVQGSGRDLGGWGVSQVVGFIGQAPTSVIFATPGSLVLLT